MNFCSILERALATRPWHRIATAVTLLAVSLFPNLGSAQSQTKLPQGDEGLASKYPGDRGISADPSVIFVEDFEATDIQTVGERWETVRDADAMSLSKETPNGSAGAQSLLITQQAEHGTGADLYRRLDDGYERVFTRMYVKFAEDCEPVHHFGTCVGGNFPATAWPSVRAGQPTDGNKSFWVGIEPFGKDWRWDYYAYWCEMRGSPPRGQTWGNSFIRDAELKVTKGRWQCIEMMLQVNEPQAKDGELALWIDGTLVSHLGAGFPRGKWVFDKFTPGADGEGVRWNFDNQEREYVTTQPGGDPFEGFRFRTKQELKVNFLWLYLYLTKGTPGKANRVWFDDVVVATEYIGPLLPTTQQSR